MNIVVMHLVPRSKLRDVALASINDEHLEEFFETYFHLYEDVGEFKTDLAGEEAAEFAFDLSNNPRMASERMLIQGRTRSLSVGDIVTLTEVDEDGFPEYKQYLCMNTGWRRVT